MKRLNNFILLLFLFTCAISCKSKTVNTKIPDSDPLVVDVFTLSEGQMTTNISLPGELRPFQSVDLYAKLNSYVKSMHVDIGSEVKKGQLLAILEAPELDAALNTSLAEVQTREALYRASKANYERMLRTSRIPGTISPNDLDMAYAHMGADSANLAAAHSKYRESADLNNYLEVRAPFNGVISSRNIYPGAYAGPAGKGSAIPLMTLEEQAKLRLVVDVPESVSSYFRQKDTVHFSVQTLPGKEFVASISRLAGSLDPKLRTEQLEMDVANPDKILLPGMFAQVSLNLTNENKVFIVPQSAVGSDSKQIFVIRVNKSKAEWIPVQKGREYSGKVEIYGALQEGESLVTNATDELKNGTLVKIEKQLPP